jgi:hypothetical protein
VGLHLRGAPKENHEKLSRLVGLIFRIPSKIGSPDTATLTVRTTEVVTDLWFELCCKSTAAWL